MRISTKARVLEYAFDEALYQRTPFADISTFVSPHDLPRSNEMASDMPNPETLGHNALNCDCHGVGSID
jgi:hypothetical protein